MSLVKSPATMISPALPPVSVIFLALSLALSPVLPPVSTTILILKTSVPTAVLSDLDHSHIHNHNYNSDLCLVFFFLCSFPCCSFSNQKPLIAALAHVLYA